MGTKKASCTPDLRTERDDLTLEELPSGVRTNRNRESRLLSCTGSHSREGVLLSLSLQRMVPVKPYGKMIIWFIQIINYLYQWYK